MLSMAQIGGYGRTIMATVLLVLAVAACGGAASVGGAPGASAGSAGQAKPGSNPDAAGEQAGNGGGGANDQSNGSGAGTVNQITQPGLLIIKTGTLGLQVAAIDDAVAKATEQIVSLGGYVAGSDRFGDGDAVQASITFRIPAARWEDALGRLRGMATKIVNERTSTQDVTGQVVDLGARIRNMQATEAAVQAIMERATDIDDVLTVQAELTKIRGEIEGLAAQKSSLEGQAAFSTLTVTFGLKPEPVIAAQEQFDAGAEIDEASASMVGILQGLATAGIWFGIVWLPIILTIAVLTLVGVGVYRRALRPRPDDGGSPAMPAPPAAA
jgi:hypothetical protein